MASVIRDVVLREEMEKLGYRCEIMNISGVEYTKFISSTGVMWLYKNANGRLPFPYVGASDVLNDKVIAARYVAGKGIRVPRHVDVADEIRSLAEYRRVLGVGESGIVIKPSDGTLSRGVFANVRTDSELTAAIKAAKEHSSRIIAQERIEGDEFRFTFVGRDLRSVIRKRRLHVTGDGNSTIRELVLDENRERLQLQGLRVRYPLVSIQRLAEEGVELDTIPGEGEVVSLSNSITIEDGTSFYEVSDEIHASYRDIAHRLSEDFGGGYLAVDVIISDYLQPATNDNYAFLEYNDIPAPMYFYACRNRREVPVMADLARYIDKILHLSAE